MKRIVLLILFACIFSITLNAQTRQEGTIVRMRMTDCPETHGFLVAMSGGAKVDSGAQCPEYVLVSEKVVYVITGKTSDQLLPLAEVTLFRMQKNEMLIRVDDARKESRFHIRAMVMRPEWERSQMLAEAEANAMISRHLDPAALTEPQR
jgi:hypothetical protein